MDLETETRALNLFERSLEVPAPQRQQWIESQVGEDRALAQVLRQLIEADESPSDVLGQALSRHEGAS